MILSVGFMLVSIIFHLLLYLLLLKHENYIHQLEKHVDLPIEKRIFKNKK